MENIVLIGNTPNGVASYLAHRFLNLPYEKLVEDYANVTRLGPNPTIGGDLVGLLRLRAFCDGGIENTAAMEYNRKRLPESRPNFGYEGPILLSYVDGGIRNKSILRVELCERSPEEQLYNVKLNDIIMLGIDGGVDKFIEERVRIVIPTASEIEVLYQRRKELEAELEVLRNRLSVRSYPKFLEQLFSEPTPQ